MSAQATPQGAAFRGADPTWRLAVPVRRVLLLVPPFLLAALEIIHPQPEATVQSMLDASTWFAGFHFIQLALVGPVGLSVLLLADCFGRASAWTTRLGVGVFLVCHDANGSSSGWQQCSFWAGIPSQPGTAAFGCFFLAALLHEFLRPDRVNPGEQLSPH
jgi:hypothetical protein